MLKKLQKRFILINMVLVGAVLLIGFCAVVFTSYVHQKANVERALNRAINMMQSDQSLFGRPQLGDNSNDEITPTMTMIVDADGNLVGLPQGSFTMQDSTLEEVRNQVFHVNASEGKLHNWNLYYKKHLQADGSTIIAFTSATALNKNIMSTVTYSILLFVSSMVVIFIISYVLSRLAIKPVRRAWNQQQQFVADASHELKTPLTVILANNDILLAHKNDSVSNQSKWVESTKAEATHMKNLVNNLLYLARSDANKGKPVFSEVPFGEITINSALQLEPVAFDNGVMLDYENVDTEVKMIGDATALNQLVQILIDNACKYGVKGGTVEIRLRKERGVVRLQVHNDGEPIAAQDLPHLFERFYRADKARTQQNQQGGYGLGLAIAKAIVDAHKGKISVTSTKREGTTFTAEFKERGQ